MSSETIGQTSGTVAPKLTNAQAKSSQAYSKEGLEALLLTMTTLLGRSNHRSKNTHFETSSHAL